MGTPTLPAKYALARKKHHVAVLSTTWSTGYGAYVAEKYALTNRVTCLYGTMQKCRLAAHTRNQTSTRTHSLMRTYVYQHMHMYTPAHTCTHAAHQHKNTAHHRHGEDRVDGEIVASAARPTGHHSPIGRIRATIHPEGEPSFVVHASYSGRDECGHGLSRVARV